MVILLFTGPLFLILGLILYRFPPRKINPLFGYRTSRSMRDQASWDLAQVVSSREIVKAGIVQSLCGLSGLIGSCNGDGFIVLGVGILLLTVVVMLIRVERKLKMFQQDDPEIRRSDRR